MCKPASIVSLQSEEGIQRWLYVCVSSHLKKTVTILSSHPRVTHIRQHKYILQGLSLDGENTRGHQNL